MEMMKNKLRINPTLACADRLSLKTDLDTLKELGASIVHIDIMDGHYVPNLCFDVEMVREIHKAYDFLLDVHLMVTNPQDYIGPLKEAGADYLSFHFETVSCPIRLLRSIQEEGMKAGAALSPAMPVDYARELLPHASFILVMGVEPGFSGQRFMKETIDKVKALADLKREKGYSYLIEVDGGIDDSTTIQCIKAGSDILVTGAFGVFSGRNGLRQDYLTYENMIHQIEKESKYGERWEKNTGNH